VHLRRCLEKWAQLWGVPDLAASVSVEFSTRMTHALGRCLPERSIIRLADRLRRPPGPLLQEVLCHEAAHLAAYRLHGGRVRPHGREWRELVRLAGYPASTRFKIDPDSAAAPIERGVRYEHRCPVCEATRLARRPMRRWRCGRCIDAGLDGRLEVRLREAGGGGSV
jgi:SprT protein